MKKANKLNLESLSEDSVRCIFFSAKMESDRLLWDERCKCLNNMIKTITKDYIWHKEEFIVYLPLNTAKNESPLFLSSVTSFGDNIEDEWVIVHLVLEITKSYPELVVQIKDNDGDFLLIEAADYLPSWANPDSTQNRVFIQGGHIHLIPQNLVSAETELNVPDAINHIFKCSDKTKVAMNIEQAILNRIGCYPDKLKTNIHKAIVKLPIDIAALLTVQPKLIAPLVGVYCSHDAIDAKCCQNVSFDNCVTHQVTFTKCLYAMLMHSKPISHTQHLIAADLNKSTIIGLKLACAFHIIVTKASQDSYSTKEFLTFVNNLKTHGYFKDNIEGSKNYKQLLDTAKEFYLNFESPVSSHIANEITKVLASDEFTKVKQSLTATTNCPIQCEDSDDWLNIHPEQLNELLSKRYGKQAKFKSNDVITSETVISQLSDFLKTTSDYEGIESGTDIESEDNVIDFDSNQFVDCVEKMLNLLSTSNDEGATNGDLEDSDFTDEDLDTTQCSEMDHLDQEVAESLQQDDKHVHDSKSMLLNIVQSMKEEKASTGPSSNLLTTIGIKKTDLLDSDDDEE